MVIPPTWGEIELVPLKWAPHSFMKTFKQVSKLTESKQCFFANFTVQLRKP
jgi:hypothetical protein